MSSGKRRPFCLALNVLTYIWKSRLTMSWCRLVSVHCTIPDSKVHVAHLGPTWVPPGSCRPKVDPILAPWTLLSGICSRMASLDGFTWLLVASEITKQNMGKLITSMHLEFLTHWGRGKMDAIFQTTFSNAFSWMKMFKFRLRFHWNLFPRVQLTLFQHWFR